MTLPVRVSVYDPVTGETATQDLPEDNYILFCGERCEVTHHQYYPGTGTHQLTIRTHLPKPTSSAGHSQSRPPGTDHPASSTGPTRQTLPLPHQKQHP